jgi:L-amino acid N-acyltransferase YncA
LIIRDVGPDDVPALTVIQNALIGSATIEWTDALHDPGERLAWLTRQDALGHPVLGAVNESELVGWASYGEFRDSTKWPGYRLTVENTVHVREDHWGLGVGRALMEELLRRASAAGLHAMIAAVDGENVASMRLHERLGFREVARLPQVGTKFGRWLDLVLLQRVLNASPPPRGRGRPTPPVVADHHIVRATDH